MTKADQRRWSWRLRRRIVLRLPGGASITFGRHGRHLRIGRDGPAASAALAPGQLVLLVDGTPRAERPGIAGVGAVVCTPQGRVLAWHTAEAPAQTSMEAEYQAVIAGLTFVLRRYAGARLRCLSDSRVVIEQLNGRYAHANLSTLFRPAPDRAGVQR